MTGRIAACLATLTAMLALSACSTGVANKSDLVDLEGGSGIAGSGNFTTGGPWDLTLTYDCSRQKSEGVLTATGLAMTVYNADDQSEAAEHPQSRLSGQSGKQLLHFKRPGPYWVAVDSKCDWHLVVIDSTND